jgi:hypothetical protein
MESKPELIAKTVREAKKEFESDPEEWLRVHMPALYGPMSGRYWVSVLRELSRLPKVV